MRPKLWRAAACLTLAGMSALSQAQGVNAVEDYLANATMQKDNRPVIGLTRRADHIAVLVSFTSDTRDAAAREQEIHTMLRAALDRASAAGVELAVGSPILSPVTRDNYADLPLQWAGREDTSKADVLFKVPLTEDANASENRINAFMRDIPRTGRGTIVRSSGRLLVVRNPAQYRADIIKLVAEDVRRNSEMFGADYRASVDGVDKSVMWSQLNGTDVFLYVPYSYRIVGNADGGVNQ
ncbi:MAG: hypothetical protein H6978_12250 [Gammaproteobacteria bacterium]|nr:hypothetical protein [Gammaproteobacteria bacterium]